MPGSWSAWAARMPNTRLCQCSSGKVSRSPCQADLEESCILPGLWPSLKKPSLCLGKQVCTWAAERSGIQQFLMCPSSVIFDATLWVPLKSSDYKNCGFHLNGRTLFYPPGYRDHLYNMSLLQHQNWFTCLQLISHYLTNSYFGDTFPGFCKLGIGSSP